MAKLLTLIFALLMSAAFVGLLVQLVQDPRGVEPTTKPATTTRPPPTRATPTKHTTKPSTPGFRFEEFALPTEINTTDRLLHSKNTTNLLFEKSMLFAPKTTKPTKNHTTASSEEDSSIFYRFSISSWYLFSLVGVFIVTALCHPTEAHCVVHGIWYLLCLPSGYLFLIIYSICNLTDRSWGTRENKVKTDSGESVTKMISDKLIWLCRGCKDPPAQEPAAEPVKPAGEMSSTSESSESDSTLSSTTPEDGQTTTETSSESSRNESEGTSQDGEGSSGSTQSQPSTPTSPSASFPKPLKPVLKKNRPGSPAMSRGFRFPGDDDKRSVHFPAKLPTFKSHTPIAEWLEGRMKQYIANFEENGYDDTSFIGGMTDQDLQDIGIETRGHRRKLLLDIEQLPNVELDNNVPENVDKWLADLGLHEYWLNFKKNNYDNPKALEDLKIMNSTDLRALLHDDLEVWKRGHIKKLTLAIRKLQYPSAIERKIREARHALNAVQMRKLKDDNDGIEDDFWTRLRELRLLPESKAFGQYSELADKLADLRNSAVLCLMVANLIWIILIATLAKKTDLKVIDRQNSPLGLAFLVVFGFIIAIQFLTMLWHRVETILHFLARAPFRVGKTSLKGWAFNDGDLPPPPSEEELHKVRQKRLRHSRRWRSSRELLQSMEEKSGEHQPLINNNNGGPSWSYQATTSRSKSPHPV